MSRFNSLSTEGAELVLSVGASVVEATTGSVDRRELLYIENRGPEPVFYGPSSDPKARLDVSQFTFLQVTKAIVINLKTSTGTSSVVVQEYE